MKDRKISKFQERLTAYHEAGHAVAYFLFGEKIKFVTIIPNFEKGYLGRVEAFGKPFVPMKRFDTAPSLLEARADFERLVIARLSGYVGEINYRYRRHKLAALIKFESISREVKLNSVEDPTFDNDLGKVRLLFKGFHYMNTGTTLVEEEHQTYFQWLWLRTVNIITAKESWLAVEAVATELLEHKRITGKHVEKVIAPHISNRLYTIGIHLNGKKWYELLD